MRTRVLAAVTSGILVLIGSVLVVGPAAAVPPDVISSARITLASGVTLGRWDSSAEYDPNNSQGGGVARLDDIHLTLGGGTAARPISLEFEPPPGEHFAVGSYRAGWRGAAEFGYGGQSCQGLSYTIVDLASNGTAITRLALRFETLCQYNDQPVFGELLLGQPSTSTIAYAAAKSPAWPSVPVGVLSQAAMPLWFRNTSSIAQPVGDVVRSGAQAKDFQVLDDGCSKRILAAGAGCVVSLAFQPRATGARSAVVTVPIGTALLTTQVSGSAPTGRTLFRATSQPGDGVGQGGAYLFTDFQTQPDINAASRSSISMSFGDSDWRFSLTNTIRQPITPGKHRIGASSSTPYAMSVTGRGHGCGDSTGWVDVKQVSFDRSGRPSTVDLTFSQTCLDSPVPRAALTGEIAYRATNKTTTPRAPFVLRTEHSLPIGQALVQSASSEEVYGFGVRPDGRAVLTFRGQELWSTPTAGTGADNRLVIRKDGTLAMKSRSGAVVWSLRPKGAKPGGFLALQTDGNLVLYSPTYVPLWTSGTGSR